MKGPKDKYIYRLSFVLTLKFPFGNYTGSYKISCYIRRKMVVSLRLHKENKKVPANFTKKVTLAERVQFIFPNRTQNRFRLRDGIII